jgi:hypothetical protein
LIDDDSFSFCGVACAATFMAEWAEDEALLKEALGGGVL